MLASYFLIIKIVLEEEYQELLVISQKQVIKTCLITISQKNNTHPNNLIV